MRDFVFNKLNANLQHINRSMSRQWLINAISKDPNVIVVCSNVEDMEYFWREKIKTMEHVPSVKPEFIDIISDLKELKMKGKPILFDPHLILQSE